MRTLILSVLACAVALAGCSKTETAPESTVDLSKSTDLFSQPIQQPMPQIAPTAVIVTVAGQDIRRSDVDAEMGKMMDIARRRMPPERIAQMQRQFSEQAVDNLITRALLASAVVEENVEITDEELQKGLDRLVASMPPGQTLEQVMQRAGWTEDELKENVKFDMQVNKLLEEKTASVGEPTDEDITAFYEENATQFDMPETVEARHILIAVQPTDDDATRAEKRALADQLHEKLAGGADFAEVAAEYSDCPSKARGGDLGRFAKGQMVKPFEDAAFSQEVDEIGPVVETQFGYHIIQVFAHHPAGQMPLDSVRTNIQQALYSQRRQEAARDYLDTLRTGGDINFPGRAPAPAAGVPPQASAPDQPE